MSLRTRMAGWLDPGAREAAVRMEALQRAATDPIPFHPMFNQTFGPGLANQPSKDDLLRESNGTFETGQRAIANRLASLKPQAKVSRRIEDGTLVDEVLDDHPLAHLIARPHPDLTWSQLVRLLGQWVTAVGTTHWLKVGNQLGVPQELHPIPPTKIEPLLSGGVVSGYSVTDGGGKQHLVERDCVIPFLLPDPEQPWTGKGFLGPAGMTADSEKFSGQHLREHYRNNAQPTLVLKPNESWDSMKPEELRAFQAQWAAANNSRFGTNRGGPAFTPFGADLESFPTQSGSDTVPLLDYWQRKQLLNMGVPRSVLGEVVSGDRSSAETNQYVFDRHTILPLATMIAEQLTLRLAVDFDPAIWIDFEEFVSDDKEFSLRKQAQRITLKMASPNMELEREGEDPVDWGEFPPGTFADVPYNPSGFDDTLPDDDADAFELGEATDEDAADRLASDAVHLRQFSPDTEWQRQVNRERAWVPVFTRALRGVFKDQRAETLKRLGQLRRRMAAPGPVSDHLKLRGVRISAEDIFTEDEWREVFEDRVEPVRETAYRAIVEQTLETLGGTVEFTFTAEQSEILRREGARLVQHVNRTTRNRLARELAEASELGESIDQIAKRVGAIFKARKDQASTIARTEILKASQQAQVTGFEVSGVVERKQWNTSRDGSVRDAHVAADGQIRTLQSPFELGDGEPADAPGVGVGGGALSAGNSVNCRCFVTPVFEQS